MLTAHLVDIAAALRVHPATVLRHIYEVTTPSWTNPTLSVAAVAQTFGCRANVLRRAIDDRDRLLKVAEAAKILGIAPSTLRERTRSGHLIPAARRGTGQNAIIRYSENELLKKGAA